jgi:hypothetical protein
LFQSVAKESSDLWGSPRYYLRACTIRGLQFIDCILLDKIEVIDPSEGSFALVLIVKLVLAHESNRSRKLLLKTRKPDYPV